MTQIQAPYRLTFLDYLESMYRYKWRVLGIMALALGLAVAYRLFGPRVYESEAKLLVRVGRENAGLDPTLRSGETLGLSVSRAEEINSIVAHLKSRVIVEQVFERVHGEEHFATPSKRAKALREFQGDIDISSPRTSTVIRVWSKGETPKEAQEIVAGLLEIFLEEHIRVHRLSGSYEFFVEQSEMLKQELEAAELEFRNAKNKVGIASIDGRRLALEDQVSKIEQQMQEVDAELAGTLAKISALRDTIDDLPEQLLQQLVGGAPNDGLADMRSQLFALRVEEQEMKSRFTESHPLMVALQRKLAEVDEKLVSQNVERSELVMALLSSELASKASLDARKQELLGQLTVLKAESKALNDAEVEITQVKRRIQQLEREYLAYVETVESTRLDQRLQMDQITNLSIIQPATLVADPVSPLTTITLGVGGIVGIALASLLVTYLDQQERRAAAGARTEVQRTLPVSLPDARLLS